MEVIPIILKSLRRRCFTDVRKLLKYAPKQKKNKKNSSKLFQKSQSIQKKQQYCT